VKRGPGVLAGIRKEASRSLGRPPKRGKERVAGEDVEGVSSTARGRQLMPLGIRRGKKCWKMMSWLIPRKGTVKGGIASSSSPFYSSLTKGENKN